MRRALRLLTLLLLLPGPARAQMELGGSELGATVSGGGLDQDSADLRYVKLTGGSVSGTLTVSKVTGSNGTAAQNIALYDPAYFTSPATVVNLYVATTGSDSTGTGAVGAPYLTISRACQDVPLNATSLVNINVAAGTYTDTSIDCSKAGSAAIRVLGASTATETWTSVGSGTPYAGTKHAQWTSTVAAFATTITDGGFWFTHTPASATIPSSFLAPLAQSTSGNLVYAGGATSGLTQTNLSSAISGSVPLVLSPFNVIFSGSVTVRGSPVLTTFTSASAQLTFIGVKFSGTTVTINNTNIRGAAFSGTTVSLNSGIHTGCYFGATATVFLTGSSISGSAVAGVLTVNPGLILTSSGMSVSGVVFRGGLPSGASDCKFCVGYKPFSNTATTPALGATISAFASNDFEQTSGIIRVNGPTSVLILSNTTSSNSVTVAVSGSWLDVSNGGTIKFVGSNGFSGTAGAPLTINTGGRLIPENTNLSTSHLAVTNTANAGQDLSANGLTGVAWSSLPNGTYTATAMPLTASRAVVSDSSGNVVADSVVSTTELELLDGKTALLQPLTALTSIDWGAVNAGCEDSSAISLPGAVVNDVCTVGPPASVPGTTSTFTCRVSSADNVIVRHCAIGVDADPAAALYRTTVMH